MFIGWDPESVERVVTPRHSLRVGRSRRLATTDRTRGSADARSASVKGAHDEVTSELERDKALVRRLVAEAINGEKVAVLDEVCTERLANELREWFAPFRFGFPTGGRKSSL